MPDARDPATFGSGLRFAPLPQIAPMQTMMTRPVGAAPSVVGSSVTCRISGDTATSGPSRITKVLPSLSGWTVSSVTQWPFRSAQARSVWLTGAGAKCSNVAMAMSPPGRLR